jgi:hypothetical protein
MERGSNRGRSLDSSIRGYHSSIYVTDQMSGGDGVIRNSILLKSSISNGYLEAGIGA